MASPGGRGPAAGNRDGGICNKPCHDRPGKWNLDSRPRSLCWFATPVAASLLTLVLPLVLSRNIAKIRAATRRVKFFARAGVLVLVAAVAYVSRLLIRRSQAANKEFAQPACQPRALRDVLPEGPAASRHDAKRTEHADAELRDCLRAAFESARPKASSSSSEDGAPLQEDTLISARSSSGVDCQLVCFSSRKFAHLRASWGLPEDVFWTSLCDSELNGGRCQASGKSGSIFWSTANDVLVVKTIERRELKTLLQGIGRYEQHFASHRSSLLCRFFGAFELQLERRRLTLVVMNNIFAGSFKPHVIYDLKGTTEDRWVNPQPGAVLKDLNFADKIIGIPDLKHKAELLHALKRDTQFLRSQNVMDYSVCLGVHYCSENVHPVLEQSVPEPGLASTLAMLRGFEPKFQCTLVRNQAAQRVIYYIGIIDILQEYDFRKVLAHLVKSMSLGWFHEIDTAPPIYYARRFKTSFWGKVQTFREPEDRVSRFLRRLRLGIESGTIPYPTFAPIDTAPQLASAWCDPGSEEVTLEEAVDFAVRCGGHLQLLRRTGFSLRSSYEEVEAFLDMDRHALVFQDMSRSTFRQRRPTSAIACYKIRRVYLSIVCHRPRDRLCLGCRSQMQIEAEPFESRRFTVEADDTPLRFTAPSRRQAKLWVTALELAAGYAEANVEDLKEASAADPVEQDRLSGTRQRVISSSSCEASSTRAAVLATLEPYLPKEAQGPLASVARSARLGMLEPYLLGPEAERRWQKRRLKWIFGFVDTEGTGALTLSKVRLLWQEMNIKEAEGQDVLRRFLGEEREWRRAGGGRQIGGGRVVQLADFVRMLRFVDSTYARAVCKCVGIRGSTGNCSARSFGNAQTSGMASLQLGADDTVLSADELAGFFREVQHVWPPPSMQQIKRFASRLMPPLSKQHSLSAVAFSQLLCSPGNALADPAKRLIFQDMTQPLSHYFIETSHNTYLEGNQLSSRSSVLRYVEVLRQGCRSVEVDVWDGADGEPVVKHGYTVTTEVLFEDVIQAIADHAFVASEFPVIISIEQHCSALQRIRQGEVMTEILGDLLLKPPWDEQANDIDFSRLGLISPWSARRRFLVKSERGCCERCRGTLPAYDRCILLPSRKLLRGEKMDLQNGHVAAQDPLTPCPSGRCFCHVSSMTVPKLLKLQQSAGEDPLRRWNARYLSRAYPDGTRINSGNVDPLPMWLCGVQMVAMNYQTSDKGSLLNEGLFRHYNGGSGYVLKPAALLGEHSLSSARTGQQCRGKRLHLRVCCGHRLPRPEGLLSTDGAVVSSPMVTVTLEPGNQVSQTGAVMQDGYHPVFNHEMEFLISDSPLHILLFEVRDALTARLIARSAVNLDGVREGFRWLALQSILGSTIPHCGLLLFAQFLHT
ncbi:unnamed protein product [Polarella glacialis]|uniref:Phosphoinositide phospholipase C n=1 Tax=Polarella glacialis TaxID=89957 RepID=A0A813EL45_POLGL|nr:unnamed protein product [Polarella glacialis]